MKDRIRLASKAAPIQTQTDRQVSTKVLPQPKPNDIPLGQFLNRRFESRSLYS